MAERFDLAKTFVHLENGGDARAVKIGPTFWRDSSSGKRLYDRLVGVFAFRSADDLHPSMQEMHPEAGEVLFLLSGAIDVVLDESGGRRTIALHAGEAVIVPRGIWHHLVMRQAGQLLFINSRTGIQNRPV